MAVASAETPRRILRRPIWMVRRNAPRLQGFAPHESPPPRTGCLGRHAARGSPGIHPLQGFLPHRTGTTFIVPPLMRFPTWAQASLQGPLQGIATRRDWLVSLETADPPGVPPPLDLAWKFDSDPIRESPPRAPGCVTVPSTSSLWTVVLLYRSLPQLPFGGSLLRLASLKVERHRHQQGSSPSKAYA